MRCPPRLVDALLRSAVCRKGGEGGAVTEIEREKERDVQVEMIR